MAFNGKVPVKKSEPIQHRFCCEMSNENLAFPGACNWPFFRWSVSKLFVPFPAQLFTNRAFKGTTCVICGTVWCDQLFCGNGPNAEKVRGNQSSCNFNNNRFFNYDFGNLDQSRFKHEVYFFHRFGQESQTEKGADEHDKRECSFTEQKQYRQPMPTEPSESQP